MRPDAIGQVEPSDDRADAMMGARRGVAMDGLGFLWSKESIGTAVVLASALWKAGVEMNRRIRASIRADILGEQAVKTVEAKNAELDAEKSSHARTREELASAREELRTMRQELSQCHDHVWRLTGGAGGLP